MGPCSSVYRQKPSSLVQKSRRRTVWPVQPLSLLFFSLKNWVREALLSYRRDTPHVRDRTGASSCFKQVLFLPRAQQELPLVMLILLFIRMMVGGCVDDETGRRQLGGGTLSLPLTLIRRVRRSAYRSIKGVDWEQTTLWWRTRRDSWDLQLVRK